MEARAARVRPLTDDKILTSWNGLAVRALCRGYRATGDERYLNAAVKNADFVCSELYRDGKLTHAYRQGRHSGGQFLEDYSYYLSGLVELYQVDPSAENSRWLEFATQLADEALTLFMDVNGALYLRDANQPDLIARPKEETDGALPAPGSMLLDALLRLGRLTSDNKYTAAAERGLRALSGLIDEQPATMASALLALDYHLTDKIEIVIVGDGVERDGMLAALHRVYLPNGLVAIGPRHGARWLVFEGRTAAPGQAVAYVCRNSACRLPVTTAADFERELGSIVK